MKVNLLDGNNPLVISEKQGDIMRKVANQIFDKLSVVYEANDIHSMDFHIKGTDLFRAEGKIVALYIKIPLKFVESEDVINVLNERLKSVNVPDNEPGLSFMNIYKEFLEAGHSEIYFWYQFTNEEMLEWNGNHIYSFDMF